ncbi:MAG: hypothetical protein IKG69_04375 [Atopobiaceae bacterium]|nr:hypothetical protein [Atopobiaceae bacterium]
MTEICVNSHGTLTVNGDSKDIKDLTQEFLEQLVKDSLDGKVNYSIEGEMPIARLFKKLDEGTKEGSELRKLKQEVDHQDGQQESA